MSINKHIIFHILSTEFKEISSINRKNSNINLKMCFSIFIGSMLPLRKYSRQNIIGDCLFQAFICFYLKSS